MFITPAFAQDAAGGGSDALLQMLPFIAIFAIMYFLIIRPQQKRIKQHQEMVGALQRGDTVVTAGGLIGKVTKIVDDSELMVEISDGVKIKVVRHTIAEVRTKGKPVKDKS
jgi:preprotein translocase subunit YajC